MAESDRANIFLMFAEILFLLLILFLMIFMAWTKKFDHWKNNRTPYIRGHFPFGNISDIILMRKTIGQVYDELYWKFPDKPFFGFFKLWQPAVMIRDPEIVKMVLVKEFESFHDNDYYVNPKIDRILGLNPFNIKGKEWTKARGLITTSLTLAKIKAMIKPLNNICKEMLSHINEKVGLKIEVYDLAGKYTTDVVCSCAFGIETHSFKDDTNEMRAMSRKMFDGSFKTNFAVLSAFFFPKLNETLKWKILPTDVEEYFIKTIKDISEYRESTATTRNDYIQYLIDMNKEAIRKSDNKEPLFTDVEMANHCMSFFLDGYETAAILTGFILFELALNENVQDDLRHEIKTCGKSLDDFDYDSIHSLQFLDLIIQETIRKHPPGTTISRVCTKSTYLALGKQKVKIEKGTPVIIPMYSIQNDPNNFKDPEVFNPLRFSDKRKSEIHPYSYFPFGVGPRSCPGQRFALSMIKLGIISIVKEYKIKLDKYQSRTILVDPMNTFFHSAKGGTWLVFNKIEKKQ